MLKITVEGNKKEIKNAKELLDFDCFIKEDCLAGITCEECKKGKVEIKYVVKENTANENKDIM